MSIDYEEYRKKIENIFLSELDKSEIKIMKKILFIITQQANIDQTVRIASSFCDKTNSHIKFINGAHYYSDKLKEKGINYLSLHEIIEAVEKSPITNSEVSIIRDGDPFDGIKDIVDASQISLIVMQHPFLNELEKEKSSQNYLGDTFEKLINDTLTKSKIPLLILKNNSLNLDSGFNHVVMAGTDWINTYTFHTLISLSHTLQARITIIPFLKESLYKESDIPQKVAEITKQLEKFTKDANEWLNKNDYNVTISNEEVKKNRFEFLGTVKEINPELLALYVPRKEEVFLSFLDIIRKCSTNVILVPERD